MCNLYDIGPSKHLRHDEWEAAVASVLQTLKKPHGIRKTDPAPVVRLGVAGCAEGVVLRWGFERSYNAAVNNARVEKLDGPWAEPWRAKRRCLFPVSTWYEWHGAAGRKQTFAFQAPDESWLWIAGLWEPTVSGGACSMITRPAEGDLESIHDRMPAVLDPLDARAFLEGEDPRELLVKSAGPVSAWRCHNPLTRMSRHRGPEPIEMLPGF